MPVALAADPPAGSGQRLEPGEKPVTAVERPAVVLRARPAQTPNGEPDIEVLAPRGLTWPLWPGTATPEPERGRADAPDLGPGFELDRGWQAPQGGAFHYYVYNVDLDNPNVARRWRELERAKFNEARRQRVIEKYDDAWERRKLNLRAANQLATSDGLALLRAGQYREAVLLFTEAADYNQSDATSRLHLAQARLALGHDDEAAAALRRALELRPHLVPQMLKLAEQLPSQAEFDGHVDALARRVKATSAASADLCFLLGFMEFQRRHYDAAYAAFQRADARRPGDERTEKYLSVCKPAK